MEPLKGYAAVLFLGKWPVVLTAQMLAELGADVTAICGPGESLPALARDIGVRHLNLKSAEGRQVALSMCASADVVLEASRPGAMERLRMGPAEVRQHNPQVVYARLTGWGQTGPLSSHAGHDINFVALSGLLGAVASGTGGNPFPPLNALADFGAGSFQALAAIATALLHRQQSGEGSVLDISMVDGLAAMTISLWDRAHKGQWDFSTGNDLDGGAPFYNIYSTSDEKMIAVGALSPKFYRAFLEGLGCDEIDVDSYQNRREWSAAKATIAARFKEATRDEWITRFADLDACVTPVLDPIEATLHPHASSRGFYEGGFPSPGVRPHVAVNWDEEST